MLQAPYCSNWSIWATHGDKYWKDALTMICMGKSFLLFKGLAHSHYTYRFSHLQWYLAMPYLFLRFQDTLYGLKYVDTPVHIHTVHVFGLGLNVWAMEVNRTRYGYRYFGFGWIFWIFDGQKQKLGLQQRNVKSPYIQLFSQLQWSPSYVWKRKWYLELLCGIYKVGSNLVQL